MEVILYGGFSLLSVWEHFASSPLTARRIQRTLCEPIKEAIHEGVHYFYSVLNHHDNSVNRQIPAMYSNDSSPAPFAKSRFQRFPLLCSSFLLIKWRSLRTFLQADFHASMKSANMNVRVNLCCK